MSKKSAHVSETPATTLLRRHVRVLASAWLAEAGVFWRQSGASGKQLTH